MAEFFRKKKKVCQMCAGKDVDYKNIEAKDDKAVKEFDRLALISSDIIRHIVINKEN